MRIDILTLFPEMFSPLFTSILKKAQEKNLIEINIVNIRDFSTHNHKQCDDTPFGGGAGMVMMCDPIFNAIESVLTSKSKVLCMSPRGNVFEQSMAIELSKSEHLIILCGHYEGIDQRVLDYFHIQEVSIGDYILTGGELPAMVIVDSICRLIPNVIKNESIENESFGNGLLEYNQYTRPNVYRDMKVPDVLLEGNHAKIDEFRKENSLEITKKNRPDLYKKYKGK